MFTHQQVWAGIDKLASRNGFSASGLAKEVGMDPTSFNKSRRVTRDGKLHWPGTETLSKVLAATDTSLAEFAELLTGIPTV